MENIITCPHCGAQYLPEEILVSDDVLRKGVHATKDSHGRIIFVDGDVECIPEMYICDFCDEPFAVEVSLSTKAKRIDGFNEECSVSIRRMEEKEDKHD